MIFWSEAVVSAVLIALTIWQWCQVRHHPEDAALKVLAVGVTTLAFVLTMSVADGPLTAPIHAVLHAISFTNIAWTLLFFCYSTFFLLAQIGNEARDPGRIRRRAAAEFVLYLAFLVPGLIALYTADPGFFGRDRDPDSYLTARNIIYYVGTAFYPILAWLIGTARAVGYLRLLAHRWARVAVAGVVLAMGVMAIGVNGVSLVRQGLYVAYPGSKWPIMSDLYNTGRIAGQILLAASLASVPLLTLAVRFRERREQLRKQRYAHELRPLWRTMIREFPDVELPTRGSAASASPGLDRLMMEVSDGLAYLAEWHSAAEPDSTTSAQIAAALDAKRQADRAPWSGQDPIAPAGEELPRWEPDFPPQDWEARAKWMLQLQSELSRMGVLAEQQLVGG